MSLTKTTHEGRTMWQDGQGQRFLELPNDRPNPVTDRVVFVNGFGWWAIWLAWSIGFAAGALLAVVVLELS